MQQQLEPQTDTLTKNNNNLVNTILLSLSDYSFFYLSHFSLSLTGFKKSKKEKLRTLSSMGCNLDHHSHKSISIHKKVCLIYFISTNSLLFLIYFSLKNIYYYYSFFRFSMNAMALIIPLFPVRYVQVFLFSLHRFFFFFGLSKKKKCEFSLLLYI